MPRPITAHIHNAAIANNLSIIKQNAPHSNTFAVLKARAYGHGIQHIYQGLTHTPSLLQGIALLDLQEALEVRALGWQKTILLLEGFFELDDLFTIITHQLSFVVHAQWQIEMLKAFLNTTEHQNAVQQRPLHVFLKMNTGMNRLGFTSSAYLAAAAELHALKTQGYIRTITHMTHFANADKQDPAAISPAVTCFMNTINQLPAVQTQSISMANSGAILWHPSTHHDWVRAGIMLYGASPSGRHQDIENSGLQPTMSLRSKIIGIQQLVAGESVGYGATFTAEHALTIGIVACGYADGYPRHAPTGTPVMVNGMRTRTLGRVSMDMIVIDLSQIIQQHNQHNQQNKATLLNTTKVDIGSNVLLWGQLDGAYLPIDEVANHAGTIGYELMCAVAARVTILVD